MNLVKLMEFYNDAKLLQNLFYSIHATNPGGLQSALEASISTVPLALVTELPK